MSDLQQALQRFGKAIESKRRVPRQQFIAPRDQYSAYLRSQEEIAAAREAEARRYPDN